MKPIVLRLRRVSKGFRQGGQFTPVLKRVDLDLYEGEMFFLVGPSGCGKTTLLSVLGGTLRADAGEIHAFGHPLHELSPAAATRFRARHVGFIFQQFHLIPTLTAAENVAVPLRLQGASARAARHRARAMLDRVGLGQKADERPSRLSGGQQQRVAIARAIVHEPPLLVCDEPTSALDSATGLTVMSLLRDLCATANRAAIVVTHDPRIYGFADRLGEMEDGSIRRLLSKGSEIASPHSEP